MLTVILKTCHKCGFKKPVDEFWQSKANKDGRMHKCKTCCKIYQQSKNGRESNRKYAKKNNRWLWLKNHFGLTIEQYNIMYENQNGCCMICGKHQSKFKRTLCIDHDHKTGNVRGLLCVNCNRDVGVIENKSKAVNEYLVKFNCYKSLPRTNNTAAINIGEKDVR